VLHLQTSFRVPRWQIHLCSTLLLLPPVEFCCSRLRQGEFRPRKKKKMNADDCSCVYSGEGGRRPDSMVACSLSFLVPHRVLVHLHMLLSAPPGISPPPSPVAMPTAMAVRTIEPKYRCTSHTARTTASACLRSWEDAVPLSLSFPIMALPKREGRDLFFCGSSSMP
jgi:hypothetical protein